MPNEIEGTKISALTAASAASDSDVLAGVQSNATKKFSFGIIKAWVKGWISKTDVGLGNLENERQYSSANPQPANKTTISTETATAMSGILQGTGSAVTALPFDSAAIANDATHVPSSAAVKSAIDASANQVEQVATDLAGVHITGTTNSTGAVIAKGTFFYLNGTLVQALAQIAINAAFTSGTNYEAVTAGGLNSLIVSAANDLTYASLPNYYNGSMKLYVLQKNFYFFSFSLGLKDVVAGTTVCTIDDASLRPGSSFWTTIQILDSSDQFQNARIVVGTNGTVKIYDVSGTISITGCWYGVA